MSFPEKGDAKRRMGQKRGEIQARFQFPISASSPFSPLFHRCIGVKKWGKGERRRPTTIPRIIRISKKASFLLPPQPAAPFKPPKAKQIKYGFSDSNFGVSLSSMKGIGGGKRSPIVSIWVESRDYQNKTIFQSAHRTSGVRKTGLYHSSGRH